MFDFDEIEKLSIVDLRCFFLLCFSLLIIKQRERKRESQCERLKVFPDAVLGDIEENGLKEIFLFSKPQR